MSHDPRIPLVAGIITDLWPHRMSTEAARRIIRALDSGTAIDADYLAHQRDFSQRTFGPGKRTRGVCDHIRKELDEIAADPDDAFEWIDIVILGLDGALRAGLEPQQVIDAIRAKQARNEARAWPDWREFSEDEAIEHVRTGDAA